MSLSHVRLFSTPWTVAHQASPSVGFSRQEYWSGVPWPSLIFPSIRVFSNESALCIRWPKYWSFGFSISPSNEYSVLISFRMDWLDVLAVQRTLKSLLHHHNSINSIQITLTSIHDYWKNHRFDYMDLCQQSDVSAFQTTVVCMKCYAFITRSKLKIL